MSTNTNTIPTKEQLAAEIPIMVTAFLRELLGPNHDIINDPTDGVDTVFITRNEADKVTTKMLMIPWAMVDDEQADIIFVNVRFRTKDPEQDAMEETFFVFSRKKNQYICNKNVRESHADMLNQFFNYVEKDDATPTPTARA